MARLVISLWLLRGWGHGGIGLVGGGTRFLTQSFLFLDRPNAWIKREEGTEQYSEVWNGNAVKDDDAKDESDECSE